jgi:threonine dehydratase
MDWRVEIEAAVDRISPHVRRTPVEPAPDIGPKVWLKCENLQVTGSFKVRGGTNALLKMNAEQRSRGVVTASSGNHGLGLARAANQLGIPATVYVPNHADDSKVRTIQNLGVNVDRVGDDCVETEAYARIMATGKGQTYVSPYNDAAIIAGQGTIGHELFQQIAGLDAVFVSIGGGGLISGIGAYLKAVNPNIKIIGCSPAASPAMHACLEAGRIFDVTCRDTLSDATAGGVEPGAITFDICKEVIDRSLLVGEADIAAAVRDIVGNHHMLIEGAAGVAVAGYRQVADVYADKNTAIVLCGANIGLPTLRKVLQGGSR